MNGTVPRRILVIAYTYPPMPVGGNRWQAMVKYLRRAGHEVTVITTEAFGRLDDEQETGVVRVNDLTAARWLRTLMRRPPLPVAGEPTSVDKPVPPIVTKVIVPDHCLATWAPFAVRAARAVHRVKPQDCVISSSSFESMHAVPPALGRSRPAWVADFRDGWTFHPWRGPFPTRAQERLNCWMEQRTVRTAERVVAVERPVRDDFRERLGVDAVHVPNGWDPELEAGLRPQEIADLPLGDRVVLVHTGRMLAPWGRSPEPLLQALARLRAQHPELAARLVLVVAGRPETQELQMIDSYRLDGMVHHAGQLSRGGSIALQRRADVLILLTAPDLVWELPGKVFEYISAKRPILALAHGNEAARVVTETSSGVTVPPEDIDKIVAALADAAKGKLAQACNPADVERYIYPAPAQAMEMEIERAISLRAGQRSHRP